MRQITTENNVELVPETTNNSFPTPPDPDTAGITGPGFMKTTKIAIEEIDSKLGAINTDITTEISDVVTPVSDKADANETNIEGLDTRLTAAEGGVSTNTSAIVTINQNIANLQAENLTVIDSVQSSNFTAVVNNIYLIDTTSNIVELTLPDDPTAGEIVAFKDIARQFSENLLRLVPGQSGTPTPVQDQIEGQSGAAATFEIGVDGIFIIVQFTNTRGWIFR